MCSGGSDGRVVLWSHVTGFKLAVFTLHSGAIHSLAFNHGEPPLSHTHDGRHCEDTLFRRQPVPFVTVAAAMQPACLQGALITWTRAGKPRCSAHNTLCLLRACRFNTAGSW